MWNTKIYLGLIILQDCLDAFPSERLFQIFDPMMCKDRQSQRTFGNVICKVVFYDVYPSIFHPHTTSLGESSVIWGRFSRKLLLLLPLKFQVIIAFNVLSHCPFHQRLKTTFQLPIFY